MKREILGIVIVVFVLLVMGSCKSTQQNDRQGPGNGQKNGKPSVEELFEKMDANEDGKLSKEEVKGPLSNDFDEIDSNEDGFLSKEEINNAPKPSGPQNGGMQHGRR